MTKITLIICTKDRPLDMRNLLTSIVQQTRRPDRMIVIDGSDNPIEHVLKEFPSLSIEYRAVRPPSLPKQRNVGIDILGNEDSWVGFLDDDLVLLENTLEELEKFVDRESQKPGKELVGAGLAMNNEGQMGFNWWRSFLLLDKWPGGVFTPSGCPAAIRSGHEDMDLEWLYGGATFWKSKVYREFKFDEWFDGTGYYEDVDFSYRVSRKYRLAFSSKSRCFHYHHPVRTEKLFPLGVWQITGWWYFVSKTKSFSSACVLWSMLGLAANNLGMGLVRPAGNRWRRGLGNLKGIWLIFTGRALQNQRFSK